MPKQRFKVRVDDRVHDAVVELDAADPKRARVEVDGEACETIDVGDGATIVRTAGDAAQTEVVLEPGARPTLAVFEGHPLALEIDTAQEAALREALGARGGGGHAGASITAPMPGRIVKVLVAPGDTIEVGTPAVIMEAMKMENELRADAAGTVASIPVAEGATVDAGQVLCEIEPQAAS